MIWLLLQVISLILALVFFASGTHLFFIHSAADMWTFLLLFSAKLTTISGSFHPFLLPRMFSLLLVSICAHAWAPASSPFFLFPLPSPFFPPLLCERVDSSLLIGFSPRTFCASTCISLSLCALCPVTNLNLTFLKWPYHLLAFPSSPHSLLPVSALANGVSLFSSPRQYSPCPHYHIHSCEMSLPATITTHWLVFRHSVFFTSLQACQLPVEEPMTPSCWRPHWVSLVWEKVHLN